MGLSRILELLNLRTKPKTEPTSRHDYSLKVVDLILKQYPEIDTNSREIVQPNNWTWDNGVYVKVQVQERGHIQLYINQEKIRMPKVRSYSIESALDDEVLDNEPDEIARRLKERDLDSRKDLGFVSTILYNSGESYGPIEWQKQTPELLLARCIAEENGFNLGNMDQGFITLMAYDIKPETVERFVKAVKQHDEISTRTFC